MTAMTAIKHGAAGAKRAPLWLRASWFSVAYYVCAELARFLSVPDAVYMSFWLPAGLYVAVLLLNETRSWPWLVLAGLPANATFDLHHGNGFITVLGFYCANTVQAVLGAWLVRRFVSERPALATLREFLGVAGYAALLSTVAGAAIGAATLVLAGLSQSFLEPFRVWWGSEAMAILLVTPLVLAWFAGSKATDRQRLEPERVMEATLLMCGMIFFTCYMLVMDKGIMAPYKTRLLPFILWAGLRFGARGAAAVNLVLALLMAFFTTHFLKGLTLEQIASGEYVPTLQSFLAISALVGLIPAIALGERDRKVTELRESEERFRNLTAAAFEGICLSVNGRITDVNDQALKLFGYERVETIGREVIEFVAPESRALCSEAIRAGSEKRYEFRMLRKDGRCLHAEAQARMVRLGNQDVRMTALRDITERKQMEDALRLSEDRFRSAMHHSPIGMAMVAPNGHWLEVNPALCAIVGYTREELLAVDFQTITHPEDLGGDMQSVRQMLNREIESYQIEKRYLHKDGHAVWIQLNVSLVWNADGSPRNFVSQIQDITGRKQAEQALRENQAKLMIAMDMAKLAHWEYDVATSRFTFNENFYKLYRTTVAQEGGTQMRAEDYARKFIPPEEAAVVAGEIEKAVAARDPSFTRQLEHRYLRADGSAGMMMVRFAIIKDDTGRTVKTCGVNQDITEQKHAEQQRQELAGQLRQAQKMEAVGQLAGGVAHDFNNILAASLMQLGLLLYDPNLSPKMRSALKELEAGANRAASLTRQLLMFSRRQVMQVKPLDLNGLLADLVKMLRRLLGEHIDLVYHGETGDAWIEADKGMMEQVVMNLCVNARDAMPDGGRLAIGTREISISDTAGRTNPDARPGQYICLSVADNGCGMDEATLKRAFEPFFTTKEIGKGTGLGLATVFGIVKQHQGWIDVESQVGKGTVFRIYLPARIEASEDDTTVVTSVIPRGQETILVVEDNDILRELTLDWLRQLGYRVLAAANGVEALKCWNQHGGRISLLLTDMVMPEGMSGLELAEQLRQMNSALKVIITSGYSLEIARRNVPAKRGVIYLSKPYEGSALAKAVRDCLDQPHSLSVA